MPSLLPLKRAFPRAGACLILGAVIYLAWPVAVLQVSDISELSHRAFSTTLEGVDTVAIGFTHSFYRVPQEEQYLLQGGVLRLAKVFFGSHDALDYYDPLSVLTREKVPGGYQVVLNPPAQLPINFAVGGQTDIWLRLGSKTKIPLQRILPHTDGFSLRVVHRPRIFTTVMEWLRGC